LVIVGVILGGLYFGKTVISKTNFNHGAENFQEVDINASLHSDVQKTTP